MEMPNTSPLYASHRLLYHIPKPSYQTKKVCRSTAKQITWRLKGDTEGLDESIMPYPRVFLFFTLHGSVIQDYLNNYEPDANGRYLTVDNVLKVLIGNDLTDEGSVERYRDYNPENKG